MNERPELALTASSMTDAELLKFVNASSNPLNNALRQFMLMHFILSHCEPRPDMSGEPTIPYLRAALDSTLAVLRAAGVQTDFYLAEFVPTATGESK